MTPWTVAHQAPLSMGFPRQDYWSGLPSPLQGVFPAQGSNPRLLHWQGILEAPGARSNSTHRDSGADGRGHTAAMELVAVAAAMVTSLSPDVSYPVFGPSNNSVKLPTTHLLWTRKQRGKCLATRPAEYDCPLAPSSWGALMFP